MPVLHYDRLYNMVSDEVEPQDGEVTTWDAASGKWINAPPTGGGDRPVPTGNLDGGEPGSQYGGLDAIDGGSI